MCAQVQKDYPHLVAGTSVARKMGFPDVILPGRKFCCSSLCSILLHSICNIIFIVASASSIASVVTSAQ